MYKDIGIHSFLFNFFSYGPSNMWSDKFFVFYPDSWKSSNKVHLVISFIVFPYKRSNRQAVRDWCNINSLSFHFRLLLVLLIHDFKWEKVVTLLITYIREEVVDPTIYRLIGSGAPSLINFVRTVPEHFINLFIKCLQEFFQNWGQIGNPPIQHVLSQISCFFDQKHPILSISVQSHFRNSAVRENFIFKVVFSNIH